MPNLISKPNPISKFFLGLIGKAWAHDSRQELTKELHKHADRMNDETWAKYIAGAGRLDSALAFQPGLVTEHINIHDSLLYVRALMCAALDKGYPQLGEELARADDALAAAMQHLADAADATIPAAKTPTASR
ncbi:hypothetical protein [Streptomyces violaceusniger]|uniref:Uncharacterized protein n=1 Tax=Streptomyces violaceusniger TaxID=68280 RepID=A0A4D4LGY6_STRVO|nr:hypothetical protein SVIO_112050 [Streptomyces violaceusniger]